LTDHTDNSVVTSLQEAGRRIACPKKSKKDPVTTEMLIDLCTQFKDCKDLLIIRYLTMILLCFAGFLRYDEISSLLCNNVNIYDEYLILFIEKAKTDQHKNGNEVLISKGNTVACPFSMFNRYLTISEIALDSKIFLSRPIFRSKNVCKLIYKNTKLSYTAARQSIISRLKLVANDLNI
jgi:integrase